MDPEPLHTFLPDTGDLDQTLLWSVVVALLGLAGSLALAWRSGRGVQRNYRLLGAMLLFFAFLIAASTAFFSWLNLRRTGPVYVYRDAIATAQGRIPFEDLRNARLINAGNRSLLDPQRVRGGRRLLLIETAEGKAHALSEEHYPVDEVLRVLRGQVKAWEGSR